MSGRCERTDIDARVIGIADLQLLGSLAQQPDQLDGDLALHIQSAGRGASLARCKHRASHDLVGGVLEVGIGQNDGRVLAAKLELNLDVAVGHSFAKPNPNRSRSGEGDRGQSVVAR